MRHLITPAARAAHIALLFAVLAPTAALADAVPAQPDAIEVKSIAAGLDVKDRQLVGQATWFHTDEERIWVHATVANSGPPQTITMVWKREGEERWRVDLKVGKSPRWRTWSRKRIRASEAGRWVVELLGPGGRALASTKFVVEDEPGC